MYQNAEEGPSYQTNMPDSFFKQHFKGSVNPEIVKNIASCNFLIISLMHINVYIS